MSGFNWRKDFGINVREIDNQHIELIAIINEMHKAISDGNAGERLGDMLERLLDYADAHFTAEEALMKKHLYHGYEEHRSKHRAMKIKVHSLINEYQGGREAMTYSVLNFLQGWLMKHIMETDKKFGVFLNNKGIS